MGEKYDIEAIMREYGNDVLRTCYSYVKDVHSAEDLYQETFIKVYKNLDTFGGESSIKTWVIRIAINTCKDFLKSAYSRHVVPMEEFMEESIQAKDCFEDVEKQDSARHIRDAVMALPDVYKDVVMCVYFNEMSVAECAKSLDISEGTVKSRLSRARDKLKSVLADDA